MHPTEPWQGARSDTVSPQASDVIDNGLNTIDREISRNFNKNFVPEKRVESRDENGDIEHVSERRHEDIDEDNYRDNYKNYSQVNSSDLESDLDKEELTPDSPGEDYRESRSIDLSQRLPSNINPYASAFGAEEARLRFSLESAQLKERLNSIGILPFSEEALRRRYSLQDPMQDAGKLAQGSLSPPSSPHSQSLQSPPLQAYKGHGPRSVHDLSFDEQDTNAFLPRIKEGLFFCHLCSFSGTTQAEFDQHMTVHFEHTCPHCDYKSRTEGRLKRHIKDFHTEDPDGGYNRTMPGRPKVFRCKQCEYSTTDKVEFWTHSRSHIKEDKLLQCPRCPFVTEYKHHLEYHLRNHFGSKPFKCPKCNYACVNKSMLNSHMKSHTNVYQYRCADCTYATKYCHSLKLHLRKYNHKPAAVLNSDGSLPQGVDATSSGLTLMAKRGPPRGPRGPRKDKLDHSPGSYLPMPPSPMGPLPGLPGMMSPFWPLMQGQLPGRLPHPLSLGPRFNPHLARFPTFGMKSEEMKSPPSPASSGLNPFKCGLCGYVGTSREVLTSHVVKVHASENQDLFSMFGLSSESLLEDSQKRMNALHCYMSPIKQQRAEMFNAGMDISPIIKREADATHKIIQEKEDVLKMSPFSFMNGKFPGAGNMKDEGIDILKQMTLKFGSGPVDLKRKLPMEPVSVSSASLVVSDGPLDLTKPRSSPPVFEQTDVHKPDDIDGEHSSGENSIYSVEVTSNTPPKKRSRKGRAFKLDTLCMKLQEKHGNIYGSDDDSAAEMDDMYTSELLPVEADRQSMEEYYDNSFAENDSETDKEVNNSRDLNNLPEASSDIHENKTDITEAVDTSVSVEHDEIDEDETEKLAEEDLRKIHASLEMLNEKSNVEKRDDDRHIEVDADDEIAQEDYDKSENENMLKTYDHTKQSPSPPEFQKSPSPPGLCKSGFHKSPSPPGFHSHSRRKPVAAAIQRGADIAWKILNDPKIGDPTRLIRNGDNGHKLELSPLDKKLWLDAPYCTNISRSEKGEYECPHCQISFGDCIMYTMHMGYHGYKDPYKCNMCGDTCKDRVEFFLHIARAAHN